MGEVNYGKRSSESILRKNIAGIQLHCRSYHHYTPDQYQGYVIYCDPPYEATTGYNKTAKFDYELFYHWVRYISKYNVVFVSGYQAPEDFVCSLEIQTKTSMQGTNGKLTPIEKLFQYKKYQERNEQLELERLLALYRGSDS